MRQHRKGDPPVPGLPLPDLVLVQAGEVLSGLEALLDPPALAGDLDPTQEGADAMVGCMPPQRWRRKSPVGETATMGVKAHATFVSDARHV